LSLKGQHSYDQGKTSYNNGAIGVSFLGNFSETELTQSQIEAFERFAEKFIEDGKIKKEYKLYHRNQLLGLEKDFLSETVQSWSNWKESKIGFLRIKKYRKFHVLQHQKL
jgi:N-acetylmuramoyl-L-alanine amidase